MNKKNKFLIVNFILILLIFHSNVQTKAANNSYLNSTVINVNERIVDSITSGDDINYYKFSLYQNGYLNLCFSHAELESDNVCWEVYLMDSDRTEVTDFVVRGSSTIDSSCNIGLPAGEYYIMVKTGYSNYSTTNYELIVNFSVTEQWEKEENDTYLKADTCIVNNDMFGTIKDSRDEDYYKFAITQSGYININFFHNELNYREVYWEISLFNSDRTEITNYGIIGSITNQKSCNIGLPAGEYYICIKGGYSYYSNIDYKFDVNYVQSEQWEKEFNNEFISSNCVNVNEDIFGSIRTGADMDYYKFNILQDGYININFQHVELASQDNFWMIALYDKYRNEIKCFYNSGESSDETSCNMGLIKGEYYVLVSYGRNNWGGSTYDESDYKLRINYYVSSQWEKEFNDSYTSADSLTPCSNIYGTMKDTDDVDYYRIDVSKDGYFNINFRHQMLNYSESYWKIILENANRNEIFSMNIKGNIYNSKISQKYLKKGKYYLIVKSDSYFSDIDYSLSCTYTTPTAKIASVKSSRKGKLQVKWNKVNKATGYELVIANDKKFSKGKKVITISKNRTIQYTISKLKSNKNYYIKVRGYYKYNGKKYYGPFSKAKVIKVK